jgi:hypothetical protein
MEAAMFARRCFALFGAASLALTLGGCVVEHLSYGTATMRWSIERRIDPFACWQEGAASMDIHVYDDRGRRVAAGHPSCTAFQASFPLLREGWYTADMTLVDGFGYDVSSTVYVPEFYVTGGRDVVIDADFPYGSFY